MFKRVVLTHGNHGEHTRIFVQVSKAQTQYGMFVVTGKCLTTNQRECFMIPLAEMKHAVGEYDDKVDEAALAEKIGPPPS